MPHVVIHVAVSLDGATTGFTPDVGTFYALARTWKEDVTLCGADTILAQDLSGAPQPGPAAGGPELIVVDSRGRIDDATVETLRNAGHWSSVRRLRDRRLGPALKGLGVVRVDSGGVLNGALLQAGLVDEISLLVHPLLVGDAPRWYGVSAPASLELVAADVLDGGLAWLRHRTVNAA